jgi:hypothetical protein
MADAATIGSLLAPVVPVVVGGLLSLAGGAGMQWYLHREKTNEDRKVRRAAKFEELITSIYDYDHWLTTQRNTRVYGEKLEEKPSPLSKLQAIVALYFPAFSNQLDELEKGADKYELWMRDRGLARLKAQTAGTPLKDYNFLSEGSKEAVADYVRCRSRLLEDLQKLARDWVE